MNIFLEKLSEIIRRCKTPANICKNIKKDSELLNWLKTQVKFSTSSISELLYLYQNPNINPVCEKGNRYKFRGGRYLTGCGGNCYCVAKSKKKTNLKKYGVENPTQSKKIQEKIRQTNLKKYGVDYPLKSDTVKLKIQETNLKKYGVKYVLQSKKIQEKITQTNIKKYGVSRPAQLLNTQLKMQTTSLKKFGTTNPSSNLDIKNKRKNTFVKRYNVENPFQCEKIKEKIKHTNIKKYGTPYFQQKHISYNILNILHNKDLFLKAIENKKMSTILNDLGVDYSTIMFYVEKYEYQNTIIRSNSYLEDQIEEFCKIHQIEYIKNTRKLIFPFEIDFYFPEANAALECHGLYWHSELGGNKDQMYHYNKWQLCQEKGIDLYQYFEDEITQSFNIIKNKILYLNKKHQALITGARKLTINWLKNWNDEISFYKNNHIQGLRHDRMHTIGAWKNPFDLVACMSVKINKTNNQMEIVRFATDIENRYPGAFTKILNWTIAQLNFSGKILSWSDNRHSNGHLYKSNGFEFVREQKPGYFVTDYIQRWRREHFMKARIKEQHPEADLSKTEWQLEQEFGYDRIWDAGKRLWNKIV